MPFNGSGTYTLPAADLPVTAQLISSTKMNSVFSDLATALSNTVARDGQSTMTGNLKLGGYKVTGLGDGTAGGPALTFTNSATTGVYSSGTDKVALAAAGTKIAEVSATGLAVTGNPNNGASGTGVFAFRASSSYGGGYALEDSGGNSYWGLWSNSGTLRWGVAATSTSTALTSKMSLDPNGNFEALGTIYVGQGNSFVAKAAAAGGSAVGTFFHNSSSVIAGGVGGMFQTGSFTYSYLGYGDSPWANGFQVSPSGAFSTVDFITNGSVVAGNSTSGEKQLRLKNASRDVYYFLHTSDGIAGLHDATGSFTRWYTDTNGNFTAAGTVAGAYLQATTGVITANGGYYRVGDDGDIIDLNDAYCSMRFASGVRIYSANKGGSLVITLGADGTITSNGRMYANGQDSNTGLGKVRVQQGGSPPSGSQGDVCYIW